jgi:hypothetical protein
MQPYTNKPSNNLRLALMAVANFISLVGTPEASQENLEKKFKEITGDNETAYLLANFIFIELARKGIKECQEEKINQLSTH